MQQKTIALHPPFLLFWSGFHNQHKKEMRRRQGSRHAAWRVLVLHSAPGQPSWQFCTAQSTQVFIISLSPTNKHLLPNLSFLVLWRKLASTKMKDHSGIVYKTPRKEKHLILYRSSVTLGQRTLLQLHSLLPSLESQKRLPACSIGNYFPN